MPKHVGLILTALVAVTLAAQDAALDITITKDQVTIAPVARPASTDQIVIPDMLSYQGKLTDTLGVPVPDGNYHLTFRLYAVASGGTAFWSEAQTVLVEDGLFTALLGAVTPIRSLPDAGTLYLGMQVGTGSELTPRLRIVSSAYTYLAERAADADLLQGKDTAALDARYVNEAQANSVTSAMVVDGTIGAAELNQMGAATGQVLKWTGSAWAPRNDSIGGGAGDNDSDWVRVGSDSVLYTVRKLGIARGGAANALYGDSTCTHVNLGVACTTGTGGRDHRHCVVSGGMWNTASGDYAFVGGGWYNTASDYSATVGGGISNTASGDYAFVGGGGYNNASGSAAFVGGGGGSNNASGTAAFVGGGAQNTASGSYAFVGGGDQNTASDDCAFVGGGYGNRADTTYATVGGGDGNAASGYCSTVGGGQDNVARGYWATVGGGFANYSYGTGGFSANSGSYASHNYSAAFNGQTTTAASELRCDDLNANSMGLVMDHPLSPDAMILRQYASAGPEMLLTFRGSAVLGADGTAAATLPDYFSILCRNPMVQVTGVGTNEVFVSEDIAGNQFAVGGKPGTKVYWTVTAERDDQVARVCRILGPVEETKTGNLAVRCIADASLANRMSALGEKGAAGGFSFRTAWGRQRYEEMKQMTGQLGR